METTLSMLKQKTACIRHAIVDMVGHGEGNTGHLGGSLSIAELMAVLYYDQLHHHPANPAMASRDRLLLSKGHAALAQYAALADCGYFPKEELTRVKTLGAILQGHPDKTKTPGIEANTGSLGQGLSIGLGMALGLKMDGSDAQVFVVMGDGELAEGQIWEAAMAAAAYRAGNLIGILDENGVQATAPVRDVMDLGDIGAKWAGFGWQVLEVDGHSLPQLRQALATARSHTAGPVLIRAHTVKGKGVSFAEGNAAFHNGALTRQQFEQAHAEIEAGMAEAEDG